MINTTYLMQKGLEPYDFFLMQLLAQNTEKGMHEYLLIYMTDEHLKRFLALDLISTVKKKKVGDHDFSVMRLSKKGREIFRNTKTPDYTEEDELLLTYLIERYQKCGKQIGNREKVKEFLAWFRIETGYSRKQVWKAVALYLRIGMDDSGGKYIPTLENLLWKGGTVFQKQPKLSESKLYQFIEDNKKLLNANKEGSKVNQ